MHKKVRHQTEYEKAYKSVIRACDIAIVLWSLFGLLVIAAAILRSCAH